LDAIGPDTGAIRGRRVHASGTFDYSREHFHAFRPRQGSPGGYLLTPLARANTDSLVLILRGWVYAPDAMTVDLARWREAEPVTLEGYALPYPAPATETDSARAPRAVVRLDHARLEQRMQRPLAGYYIVMTSGPATGDSTPSRLGDPEFHDGPHLSYAVQWFLFATTFVAGGLVVAFRGRRNRAAGGKA
jgi:surfeit locus 1 family protein